MNLTGFMSDQPASEHISFIKDYLTRYKQQVTFEEIREDFQLAFEETANTGVFDALWANLKRQGLILMVPRSRPGQESYFQWAPDK